MRGVISGIVPDGTYGQIAADDGQRYSYWSTEVRNGQAKVGQTVEFQMWEGQPVDIFVVNNQPPPNAAPPQRSGMPPQRSFASAAPTGRNTMPAGYAARHGRHQRRLVRARLLDQAVHLAVGAHLAPAILAAWLPADIHRQHRAGLDSHPRPADFAGAAVGQHLYRLQALPRSRLPGLVQLGLSRPARWQAAFLFGLGLLFVQFCDLAGCWRKSCRHRFPRSGSRN